MMLLISLTLSTTSSAEWWNGWSSETMKSPAPTEETIENPQATNNPWGNYPANNQGITISPNLLHYQQMKRQLAQQRTQLELMLKNIIAQQEALEASKPQ